MILWFEVERYGWIEGIGSSFYVEFQLSKSNEFGAFGHGTIRERLAKFLTSEELENFRRLRDEVIASVPPLAPDSELNSLKVQGLKIEDYNYDHRGDIWCRYYSAKDVKHWANLILPIISRAVSELSSGHIPEQASRLPPTPCLPPDDPEAERRFHDQSIQLEGVIKGKAPVQGTGMLNGKPFYFLAKNTDWKFTVGIDANADPCAVDSSHATEGFFKVGDNHYFFAHGYYGPGDEASFMRYSTAERLIRNSVAQFLKLADFRSQSK